MEVEVFLWLSLACAVSQVLHQTLSDLYYNPPSDICNYSGLPLFGGPGVFHLSTWHIIMRRHCEALMKLFKAALLLLELWIAVNWFQLAEIGQLNCSFTVKWSQTVPVFCSTDPKVHQYSEFVGNLVFNYSIVLDR